MNTENKTVIARLMTAQDRTYGSVLPFSPKIGMTVIFTDKSIELYYEGILLRQWVSSKSEIISTFFEENSKLMLFPDEYPAIHGIFCNTDNEDFVIDFSMI